MPGAGDAKAFDRYAYVGNSPIKYNDPSGHGRDCGIGMGCVGDPPPTAPPSSPQPPPTGTPLDPSTMNDELSPDQWQDAFFQAVVRHQKELPSGMTVKLFLAMASAECGYDNGWDNYCRLTAGGISPDGIMQLTNASAYHHKSGAYSNTHAGFDAIVKDTIEHMQDLLGYNTEGIEMNYTPMKNGASIRLLLYYNGGGSPRAKYLEGLRSGLAPGQPGWEYGNPQYLGDVAKYLVDSPFGSDYNDFALASDLLAAQEHLNAWLSNEWGNPYP